MEKVIVEVGMLLDKDIEYYNKLIEKVGGQNVFNCETHDLYWTNIAYDQLITMTENQIKKSCVRFRMTSGFGGSCFSGDFDMKMTFENFNVFDGSREDKFSCQDMDEFKQIQDKLESNGWYMVLDTFKVDYQYKIGDMKSALQFQEIDKVGLLLYYDNPEYYEMSEDNQREMLLRELNDYGFNFDKDELGIDKFRTLLTGATQYSKNQNG